MADQLLLAGPTFIEISPTAAGFNGTNYVDYGLMDVAIPESHNVREIPSYKSFAEHGDTGRDDTRRVAFAFDLRSETLWMQWLEGTNQNRLFIERGIEGNTSGKPKESLQVIVTNYSRVETDNILRFSVEGNMSGTVDYGTF